jgi:flagellar biosynthesis protein FlhA
MALLVDLLFSISFIFQAIVVIRSSKGSEISEGNIPLLFIVSVIARWLAGVLAHIALLSAVQPDGIDGLVVNTFYLLLKSYSPLTMTFTFLSLAILNMMITSRGISRATEVTARFYLDSVPGRQMSVDADLASGAMSYETANRRRANINHKSSQYSMLDGISKFMVSEGITSSLILVLSVLFVVPWARASSEREAKLIIALSIGIMWQLLQFLSAMCYGYLLMAISKEPGENGSTKRYLDWTNGIVVFVGLAFSLFDRVHYLYLMVVLSTLFLVRRYSKKIPNLEPTTVTMTKKIAIMGQPPAPISIEIDPVFAAKLACEDQNIANQISHLRDKIEQDLGFQFPSIVVIDNTLFSEGTYTITIRGVQLVRSRQMLSSLLAVPSDDTILLKQGRPGPDPVFGIPSFWIKPNEVAAAIENGCTVTDNIGVILTHLAKTINEHPQKALLPQETRRLLKGTSDAKQTAEIDASLGELSLNTIHSAFVRLLEEGFSLANISYIQILLSEAVQLSLLRVDEVTAYLRHALAVEYLAKLTERQGRIDAITLSPSTIRDLEEIFINSENEHQYTAKKEKMISIFGAIYQKYKHLASNSKPPIIVTKIALRSNLAASLRSNHIPLFVAAFDEIGINTSISIVGTI